ncbi:MAG: hypothetical protein ACR2HD_05650 [Solirubrobacteraceae bacterium]|nr:MAG: hypothetical protein DLM63_03250 [Solirubrobacterales bacterium]
MTNILKTARRAHGCLPASSRVSAAAVLLAAAAIVGGGAPAARASFVPATTIDGPDAGIVGVGNVAVTRAGGGAVVYVKSDAGGNHVWLVELLNGVWQTPSRVDAGQDGTSGQPTVGVNDGGGMAVAWVNEGKLYAVNRPRYGVAATAPTLVYAPSGANVVATNPSVSLSINGAAYIAFTTATSSLGPGVATTPSLLSLLTGPGPMQNPTLSAGTVRVARFDRSSWTTIDPAINIDAANSAGLGAARPAIVAGADGNALVAWGEVANATSTVWARRINRLLPSAFPQQVSLPSFQGHAGENADSVSVGLEDDTSYGWVLVRQDFDDGGQPHSRALARALVGSLLQPPVAVDGLGFGGGDAATAPALTVDYRGRGLAVAGLEGAHGVVGAQLNADATWAPAARIDSVSNGTVPQPVVASGQYDTQTVAWEDSGAGGEVRGRHVDRGVYGRETVLSDPTLGPALPGGGLSVGMDQYGDAALVFVQASASGRRLVGSLDSEPPTTPRLRRALVASRTGHPAFSWGVSFENWGPIVYQVDLNGAVLQSTAGLSLTSSRRVADGNYAYRVVAVNSHGVAAPSASGRLIVASVPPRLRVKVSAAPRAGAPVRVVLRVVERVPGAIRALARILWGDGTVTSTNRVGTHRYVSPGDYRVRIVVVDVARNVAVRTLTLHVM